MGWLFFWRPPCLLKRVLVNVTYNPGEALEGVLWSSRGGWLTLRDVHALTGGQPPAKVDGEVVIHTDKVAYFQVLLPVIVQSGGQLTSVQAPAAPFSVAYTGLGDRALPTYDEPDATGYGAIYATQPNIRIPIDFLAGNVAQLGIHVFRRVSDTDRERLVDHQLAQWLRFPNPATTQFRLIEALLGDLGLYKNAYWLKIRYAVDGVPTIGLIRLPPEQIRPLGGLLPSTYRWTSPTVGEHRDFAPSEIVAFGGYNPCHPLMGLSPIETLHRIISEDAAASAHREHYWRNASRHEGVIERPREAPKWDEPKKKSFREQWQQRYAGAGNAGLVAVLEDGMTFKPTAFSPKDSEYIQGGKLRREVTAAQYNVPQPSIGILDHATFSNIREQHKQLYQDSLGPTLEMIGQEIERQLLPECDDQDHVYIEFNIAAKLAGSFEEQSNAIRTLVGRPIMTPNEGRARLNLPAIKNDPTADQIAPQQGGPSDATAQPQPTGTGATSPGAAEDIVVDDSTDNRQPDTAAPLSLISLAVQATRSRQRQRLAKVAPADRSSAFFAEIDRWNRELAADLAPVVGLEEGLRLAVEHNVAVFVELETLEVA